MTPQEIYDTVKTHLHTQGRQAADNVRCLYREPITGFKCAVGCLIPDDVYDPEMENLGLTAVLKTPGLAHLRPHQLLLVDLQRAHDGAHMIGHDRAFDMVDLTARLTAIAKEHGLIP